MTSNLHHTFEFAALPLFLRGSSCGMAARTTLALREDGTLQQYDDPNRVIVSDEEHNAIRNSRLLRQLIRNKRLQRCIVHVDGAEDRAAALERAMLNPDLRQLVDEALLLIGKAEKAPDGSVFFTG